MAEPLKGIPLDSNTDCREAIKALDNAREDTKTDIQECSRRVN